MKKILLFVFTLVVVLGLSAPPGYSASITLNPIIDTFAYEGEPNTPQSGWEHLFAGRTSHTSRSFLKFDLISIPDDHFIANATLELFCDIAYGSANYKLHHVASDNLVTNGLTWNNQPAVGSYLDEVTISDTGLKSWDLFASGDWNSAADLNDDDGFVSVRLSRLNDLTGTQYAAFHNRNYTAWDHVPPKLVIDYTPVPIPTTIFLLGSCLIGLAGIRKKLKK